MDNVILTPIVSEHVNDIFRIPVLRFKYKYLNCDGQYYHFWSFYAPQGCEKKDLGRVLISCAWSNKWEPLLLLFVRTVSQHLVFLKSISSKASLTSWTLGGGWQVKFVENKTVSCRPEDKTNVIVCILLGQTRFCSAFSSSAVFCLWGLSSSSQR